MTKDERIAIFKETTEYARVNGYRSKTLKFKTSQMQTIMGPYITNMRTVNLDTVSAARKYHQLGKTAILNMASWKTPGGGVRRGSQAQEECLFRCSNLGDAVPEKHYPLKDNEGLYTYGAYFFRDFHYGFILPFQVDVITVPAYNLNKHQINGDSEEYIEGTKEKIRLILWMAHQNSVKNVILGAWGCGVYANDPVFIANTFKEVIKDEFKGAFRNIIFAVINDSNSMANNYHIFGNTLNTLNFCEFEKKELHEIFRYLELDNVVDFKDVKERLTGDQIAEMSWEGHDEFVVQPRNIIWIKEPYPSEVIFTDKKYLRMKRLIETVI